MGPLPRATVLAELRNQTIRIDGLASDFTAWPFAVNPAVHQVRSEVDEWLRSHFPHHPKLLKMIGGDYGLFGATWWPCACPGRLRIATFLSIWLFMWDDEIDSDVGSLSDDLDMAQKYRSDTMDFVQNCLGLGTTEKAPTTVDPIIYSFKTIGDALRQGCTLAQRRQFMDELDFFMVNSEIEQRLRLSENVTGVEDFWQYRLGTSAVRVVLCLNEYCNSTDLPDRVMQNEDMAKLWDLTNINICSALERLLAEIQTQINKFLSLTNTIYSVNDLLSVKKEIAQGSTDSLVPILYSELGSVQAAVAKVMTVVEVTIKEFDIHAERLLQHFSDDATIDTVALQRFVDGCRYYCTGNLSWSLETGRYGVNQDLGQNEIYIEL